MNSRRCFRALKVEERRMHDHKPEHALSDRKVPVAGEVGSNQLQVITLVLAMVESL